MIGAIATFEREPMLERQAEGIAMAKQRIYKGRKPTAMARRGAVTTERDQLQGRDSTSNGISHPVCKEYQAVRGKITVINDKSRHTRESAYQSHKS